MITFTERDQNCRTEITRPVKRFVCLVTPPLRDDKACKARRWIKKPLSYKENSMFVVTSFVLKHALESTSSMNPTYHVTRLGPLIVFS
jgi:hypothetical protein